MRTIFLIGVGVFLGREYFLAQARIEQREKQQAIRKNLEKYIKEDHPELSPKEISRMVEEIMHGA